MSQSFAFEHPDIAFFQTLRSYCGARPQNPEGLVITKKPAVASVITRDGSSNQSIAMGNPRFLHMICPFQAGFFL